MSLPRKDSPPSISGRRRLFERLWLGTGLAALILVVGLLVRSWLSLYTSLPATGGGQGPVAVVGNQPPVSLTLGQNLRLASSLLGRYKARHGSFPAATPSAAELEELAGDNQQEKEAIRQLPLVSPEAAQPGTIAYFPYVEEGGKAVGFVLAVIQPPEQASTLVYGGERVRLVIGRPPFAAVGQIDFDLPGTVSPAEVIMGIAQTYGLPISALPAGG